MKKFDVSNVVFYVTIALICLIAIIFHNQFSFLVLFSTIMGVLATKMASSGKWHMFVFDILSNLTYVTICLSENYYGEMILANIIILVNFLSLLEWRNNQKDGIVVVNKINKFELGISFLISIVFVIIYSIILHLIHSQLPILNAMSTVLYILGSYFCFRRSILQFYVWIGYEITYILLWFLSGNVSGIILLIGGVSELIYDFIGVVNWKGYSKFQHTIKSQMLKFI